MPSVRCSWADSSPLLAAYHDDEWGQPQHDDLALFEQLLLVTFQAGLSWDLILRKRPHMRRAFDGPDPAAMARYGDEDLERLLADPGIIRNRAKVHAAVHNARCFLEVQREFGSFDQYVWSFTGGKTVSGDLQTTSPLSDAVAADLRRRGFKFIGSITCHSYLQSIGMVDDHDEDCYLRITGKQAGS